MTSIHSLIILLTLLIFTAEISSQNVTVRYQFNEFKKNFGKVYASEAEEDYRFEIFEKNLEHINKHNERHDKGLVSYRLGINEYTDMDAKEFQQYSSGGFEDLKIKSSSVIRFMPTRLIEIPLNLDWRDYGAVTPVKKQNKCGSCWAFAAVGALEGQQYRKTGKLVSLSAQNLLDCTLNYRNKGCQGGRKEIAFQYVVNNRGIATESSYPYKAEVGPSCLFPRAKVGATASGFISIPSNNELLLTMAVAIAGPVAVAMNGQCLNMQFYHSGIFDDPDCDPNRLGHAVLIVGYGQNNETSEDYWIIKNSWGTKWGMDGYMLVPRYRDFAGISRRASFPLV